MVNSILPRLLGVVRDEPASLKIPGRTTNLTMIIESQLTDDYGCEYSSRVRSRNQYLSSLRATTFLDGCDPGNGKDFFTRNRPLYVQPLPEIEGAYLPLRQTTHLPSCFATVSCGLMQLPKGSGYFYCTVPRRHRGNLRFCIRPCHTSMVLRYLCLAEGHASPRGEGQNVRLGMSMTRRTRVKTPAMLNEGQG